MTRVLAFLTGVCFLLFSCHNVAKKAEDVASTATTEVGKAVGKTSTEFVNGVKEGVDNAYGCTLVLAPRLRSQGMETGKFVITKDSSENRNRLSVYFIFNKSANIAVTARITDTKGLEYGRAATTVIAKKGDARFIDFTFDKRTDIEGKSIIQLD